MVRAPCCEKMGLKKGPWTPEEDQILINYIQLYGHGNWRALPKQAGLLRCGKSCRLRWTNYLRPDIKRGNFSEEEEQTIINLHQMLGNRWSAIAARLPGRTDNEIKNVWHTHLKKKLKLQNPTNQQPRNYNFINVGEATDGNSNSHSSSNNNNDRDNDDLSRNLPEGDDDFWLEVLDQNTSMGNYAGFGGEMTQIDFPFTEEPEPVHEMSSNSLHETMDFWYHIFARGGEFSELKEII